MSDSPIFLAKKAAAFAAAEFVDSGMTLGLGSGSTASLFIERLGEKCKEGLDIKAVASSKQSEALASIHGIPLIDPASITSLDLTIDGADEIDPEKQMIKGGGGALLKEKILANISREMIVIVDESKQVKHLGKFPLPVEISPFAYLSTLKKLSDAGYEGLLRSKAEGGLFVTDSGGYIFDIHFKTPCFAPEDEHMILRSIPGVIDTGFFFNLAGRVIVGFMDGHVEIHS